ncbi:MAG: hypothetical protein ACQEQF_00705 [Bacillota bacterium]
MITLEGILDPATASINEIDNVEVKKMVFMMKWIYLMENKILLIRKNMNIL